MFIPQIGQPPPQFAQEPLLAAAKQIEPQLLQLEPPYEFTSGRVAIWWS
jgi:hypothetical protein